MPDILTCQEKLEGSRVNWHKMTPEERLWARVDRRGPDECWPFLGATKHHPYGQIRVDGKDMTPARFAYILANGSIPDDKDACHTCDTPPCCNAAHIFAGTHRDNMRDKCLKGRANTARGERASHVKLTEAAVRRIRADAARGTSLTKLAREYGMTQVGITYVVQRRNWRHIT